jgi:uncharacterized membrane protein
VETRGGVLTGLGMGAGLMYLLDPTGGRRRRALVRDRLTRSLRVLGNAAGATGRDVSHRAAGLTASLRSSARAPVDDRILVERVRSRIGRVVTHPHALEISARDGVITVRGPVLQAEAARLLSAIKRVRGVHEVVNELEEHREPGNIPALQGKGTSPGPAPELMQRNWSPRTRLATGATGTALAAYGASRRDIPGTVLAIVGFGLIARAATNLEWRRLTGIGAHRRAVDVQKTITIDASIEDVFEFWSRYQNFPRFMSRVLDVQPGELKGQSHWKVAGPGGVPVEFDAVVSAVVPNKVFGWRTVQGAPIAHAGIVRFEPTDDGRTRLSIRMSYNPPGGWLGHGMAAAFGVDPKSSLDEDLARMKTFLETGRPAGDAAQPRIH